MGTPEKATLRFPWIQSPACAAQLSDVLSQVQGVSQVQVFPADGLVHVQFDPEQVSLSEIQGAAARLVQCRPD
ncbi:MAG: hypothetical protein IMW99_10080 [Firmicutes bacterium]|nr:hypothetical protein [Bacillota bacterium]